MDNDSKLRLLYIGKMLQETDEDGTNSLPYFLQPLAAKKNGDFHPETMSFRHLITQSGAFCFSGSKK